MALADHVGGVDAVLVTHEHPDHYEPGRLRAADAPIWTGAAVAAQIAADAPDLVERVTVVAPGETFAVGVVEVGLGALLDGGEDVRRVLAVATWRESPFFTPAERAALALTDAVTRLGEHGVDDDVWAAATASVIVLAPRYGRPVAALRTSRRPGLVCHGIDQPPAPASMRATSRAVTCEASSE